MPQSHMVGKVNNFDTLAGIMGCGTGGLPCSYSGLPDKFKTVWYLVIDTVQRRLGGWRRKLMSKGVRVILTRSVLSSLLIHYMSLLATLVRVAIIELKMRDFLEELWSQSVGQRCSAH
ncbi:hypothetical protein IFM89_023283 [Coptis chinensis]|uniref:Uncharacterized protein n=1 Tax=Coptis chinensis TaxID=261450 RepID=A0A835H6B3_9MAGN|nr:hypothetical protein IFM89_023283 [Coptis chinensis]